MIKLKRDSKTKALSQIQGSVISIIIILLHLLLQLIVFSGLSLALPPLPTEFYGRVRDYNYNGSSGEIVQAYDTAGTLCGSFVIVNSGFYGSLTCAGDDPETIADEGASAGENISLRYKGSYTTMMGDHTWDYGVFRYVNITYPVVFCGDYFCDAWYETYASCPFDCPVYNGTGNYTYNYSQGGGGGESGGSGGEEDGGESLGIIPQSYLNYTGINDTGQEGLGILCVENWECGNWSACRIDGFQNRSCIDKNDCETFEDKPPEVQKCFYTPTCYDGVRNGLEEDIDCGGLCKPCINCFDGIQNCHDGTCEEGTDCGGPCPACPTCFDGKQNCHDGLCEEGTDCDGPCEKKCPTIQITAPVFACKKDVSLLSEESIICFLIILLIILGDVIYSNRKIRDIGKNKKLTDIKRIKSILSVKRKMYLFIFIILLISIILFLYYYFFILCEVEYRFLWLILSLLFISPIIIHQVIKYIEYTEGKRLRKIETLLHTHYKQIENLIKIENENLGELEEEIANELYRLLDQPQYKKEGSLEKVKLLKEIYKELVFLYSKYKERENPIEKEKILCNDIYRFIEQPEYNKLINQDYKIANIVSKLKLLYKQYEEKQKLYDEIGKIEYSENELKYEEGEKKE